MSKELLNLTNLFHKLATGGPKISVVENTDPVLKELSEIKDFDERVEFAKEQKGWELLGTGSARAAFKMDEKRIIKIAINRAGHDQNLTEADPKKQSFSISNPIYAFAADGAWIIAANNESINVKEFKALTGMSFVSFGNAIKYKFDSETDKRPPNDYEDIENNPVFKDTTELVLATDLLPGDICKISSWGKIGERVVLRDTGLDRQGWISNYKDSGEAKTDTSKSKSSKSDSSSAS
jgi:hypothetical protein